MSKPRTAPECPHCFRIMHRVAHYNEVHDKREIFQCGSEGCGGTNKNGRPFRITQVKLGGAD